MVSATTRNPGRAHVSLLQVRLAYMCQFPFEAVNPLLKHLLFLLKRMLYFANPYLYFHRISPLKRGDLF